VAQTKRIAQVGKVVLVSATQYFSELKSDQVDVWFLNDVDLSATTANPSDAKAPETSHWKQPVCRDKPEDQPIGLSNGLLPN